MSKVLVKTLPSPNQNVDSLLTAGAFAFLGVFLWVLTVFKIIEIRMSDVSSFFGGDFTLAPTSHGKRRQFSWDAEAKAGWEPCEVKTSAKLKCEFL